ncbi:MAG: hypothetical protein IT158_16935 [Bryobacterales bacterium]|nr:hypothetical protein [Bryobacterales bacterium]
MGGTIAWLLLTWGLLTGAFVAVMIWKSLVGMKEENVLFIGEAEAAQLDEQKRIVAKVERLTSLAKAFGIASATLLIVTGGVWLYQGFTTF